MSKAGSAAKVKLSSYDDLFGNAEEKTGSEEQIIRAKLTDLHEFRNHPFRVLDDEKMEETTESISKYGVLVPGIARQVDECRQYTVEEIFCCAYAPYFWQAIQIRYPEYATYNHKLYALLGGTD